jgi:hypothetical protein
MVSMTKAILIKVGPVQRHQSLPEKTQPKPCMDDKEDTRQFPKKGPVVSC